MRKSVLLAVVAASVAVSAVAFLVVPSAPAQDKPAAGAGVAKWEYKFSTDLSEAESNRLGNEGWEFAGSRAADRGGTLAFIFKRPKR